MVSSHYSVGFFSRLILLFVSLCATAYFLVLPEQYGASTLLIILVIMVSMDFLRFANKTNTELARFFDALQSRDFSQRFDTQEKGSGFGDLATRFFAIMERLQQGRQEQQTQVNHLKALVEHIPVPLLSVHQTGKLTLWNNSARRLLSTGTISQLNDLQRYGDDFVNQITALRAGERRLARFSHDKLSRNVTLQATQIVFSGRQEKLVSIQDIQSELDGAQLQAWQDLVRVLTHEIMNSITPVTSLAKTAVELVEDVKQQLGNSPALQEELDDVADAVNTVSRRSDGLMQFVTSYRKLTRLPPAQRKTVQLEQLIERSVSLASQQWQQNILVQIDVQPPKLTAELDTDMVEQLLLNLLQNAGHAVSECKQAKIEIHAYLNKRGQVVVDVEDNGPGVPNDIADQIFVPFFTTKREGSGVGLALTRQVMQAHGGSVVLNDSELGGAQFTLVF